MAARHCEHWWNRRVDCLKLIYDVLHLWCPQFNQNVIIAASVKGEGPICAHSLDYIEVTFVSSTDNVLEGSRTGSVTSLWSALFCIISTEIAPAFKRLHILSFEIFCFQLNSQMHDATRMSLVCMSMYNYIGSVCFVCVRHCFALNSNSLWPMCCLPVGFVWLARISFDSQTYFNE
jgi:hypothetical protein